MNFQKKKNKWGCLVTSFAMAFDTPVDDLIEAIGHDGSRIVFPWMTSPMCLRGFHVQECIRVGLGLGFSVTPLEFIPMLSPFYQNKGNHKFEQVWIKDPAWWADQIKATRGVITGIGQSCPHAVAYEKGTIYDPDGEIYEYSLDNCEERQFFTQCLWIVNDLNNSPKSV